MERLVDAVSVLYGKATSYLPVIDLLKAYFVDPVQMLED
jgi:hypothetical protein